MTLKRTQGSTAAKNAGRKARPAMNNNNSQTERVETMQTVETADNVESSNAVKIAVADDDRPMRWVSDLAPEGDETAARRYAVPVPAADDWSEDYDITADDVDLSPGAVLRRCGSGRVEAFDEATGTWITILRYSEIEKSA